MQRPVQHLYTLSAAMLLLGACMAAPAWVRFGVAGLEAVAWSALGCLAPAFLLELLQGRFQGRNRALVLVVVGMLLRVLCVLGVGLALTQFRPALRSGEFFLGLAAFYFAALAVETRHLLAEFDVRSKPQAQA